MALDVPPVLDSSVVSPPESVVATLEGLQTAFDARRGVLSTESKVSAESHATGGCYSWKLDEEVERKWCVQWLTRAIEWATKRSMFAAEEEDCDKWAWVLDTAAVLLSELCGKGASGPVQRRVKLWGRGGEAMSEIAIREPSFVQADVGCQTWGSAVLLSRRIARESIGISGHAKCLELGSGTGLLGLTVGKMVQKTGGSVVMTDYLPSLLKVIRESAEDNGLLSDGTVAARHLDWFEVAERAGLGKDGQRDAADGRDEGTMVLTAPRVNYSDVTARGLSGAGCEQQEADGLDVASARSGFDLVVAADVLYEVEHARVIPVLADYFLATAAAGEATAITPRFIITVPLRSTHWNEVNMFEAEIAKISSLRLVSKDDASLVDDLSAWQSTLRTKYGLGTAALGGEIDRALESDSGDTWNYRTYIFERRQRLS
ncbi:hypothetical protein GQ54DRAFT_299919 [Martensiomyces pterosporus]|nr:hypothetical protein GQ54DRAFT_299919 [Martensiomyces pterosporus]